MKYTAIAVLYNPNSTGSSEALARDLTKRLQERLPNQAITLLATQHAGHGEELAYSLSKKTKRPLIISSSGDGGYHEVVNGAMRALHEGYNPTTSLLPAGNANDHYNNLHEEDLIELIVAGKVKNIDLLKLNATSKGKPIERYAHSYIGLGLTPIVGQELNKNKLNIFNQVWIVARALFAVKPVRLILNRKPRYYDSVIFSNVDRMSKYLKVSQPSRVTDGKFEVTIFKRRNKIKLIGLLLKASSLGVKEDAQVKYYELKTINETLLQADGEIVTLDANTKVLVQAEKQILRCII